MPVTGRLEHFETHWKTALCHKAVTLVLRDPETDSVNVIMRAFHACVGGPDQEVTSHNPTSMSWGQPRCWLIVLQLLPQVSKP